MRSYRMIAVFQYCALALLVTLTACGTTTTPSTGSVSQPKTNVSPEMAKIAEAAKNEKEVTLQIGPPTSLTGPQAAQRIEQIVKKYSGVDLKVSITSEFQYSQVASKLVMEAEAKAPPSFDAVYLTDGTITPLYERDLLEKVDWSAAFDWIKKDDLFFDGKTTVIVATMPVLPAYNTNLVKAADAPKTWEEISDPKWKGKIISGLAGTLWTRLAQPDLWGEERTTQFVQGKMLPQQMALGRYPDMYTRLAAGEFAVATDQIYPYVAQAAREKSPMAAADKVEPVILYVDVAGVPKGAVHPNAAKLVVAAMVTDEGQKLWAEGWDRSSAFRSGTPMAEFTKGKKLQLPDMDFQLKNGTRLGKKFHDILVKK